MRELVIDLDAHTSKMTPPLRYITRALKLAIAGYSLENKRGRYYLKEMK